MTAPVTFRQQNFDLGINDIFSPQAKEPLKLSVDKKNAALTIDHNHGVGRVFQQSAKLWIRIPHGQCLVQMIGNYSAEFNFKTKLSLANSLRMHGEVR